MRQSQSSVIQFKRITVAIELYRSVQALNITKSPEDEKCCCQICRKIKPLLPECLLGT